ncbi:hypothetical protein GCM10009119_23530 [Algoriphagus jejuensis]|uniref:Tail sheath protein C-terminal domain-containing protein n=1 Tax=Algoriphagus jejuensis TaxID=419934 RepID=A0ABP3YDD3_9BACT
MAKNLKTPGVYIEEKNTLPNSIAEVATAIPAFVGYTEQASMNGESLVNRPTRITSLADYEKLFGGAFSPKFILKDAGKGDINLVALGGRKMTIRRKNNSRAFLYHSIRLFYANGGGLCYIVSVGTYADKDFLDINKKDLLGSGNVGGLQSLLLEKEPTMIVVPDAVALGVDGYDVYRKVIEQCAKMKNRVAIIDICDGFDSTDSGTGDSINVFREKIGTEYLSYAAAYYPWLETNLVKKEEVTFKNLDESVSLEAILPETQAVVLVQEFPKSLEEFKTKLKSDRPELSDKAADVLSADYIEKSESDFHLRLSAISPTYVVLMDEIRSVMNLLPASAAMAGIYSMVDNSRGVWKAPSNVGLSSVIKPAINITHNQQEDFNVDTRSGKSINSIRTFPGVGTLVWGASTLDGNSLDWRYINVRRTMIMLEQSINLALKAYVFEPNDANTWSTVKSLVSNFLMNKWKQGALAGSSPADAFDVQVGLGTTMTSVDILEGKMLMSVKLAISRPAEFIVITFEQQMQKP